MLVLKRHHGLLSFMLATNDSFVLATSVVAQLQRNPSVNICCIAGQYSYFPGCAPKLTRYFPGSKLYESSQFICTSAGTCITYICTGSLVPRRNAPRASSASALRLGTRLLHSIVQGVYGGCRATNRLMHGRYSTVQATPSTVYYTTLGLRPRAV